MSENRGDSPDLAERVRTVRLQLYGECGGPMMAEQLGIPQRRLARIEAGGPISAELILKLINVTGVNLRWLLSGEGETYVSAAPGRFSDRCPGARPER